ncbi:MAG: MFS transporter [Gemmatimonadota bacterium]|nr:MFS transporter [Gemmatimonadota bacterium]
MAQPRGRLGLLFLAVLVDLVGFGIVLPLLPFYARDLGAGGLQVGLLVTVYSAVQLVMAPLWGRISDRFGRRRVLILGLLGSAAAYVIFARADSLALLFLSRIVGGIGGSTIPVAQAYIADVTPPTRRAGNMGLIGAAFGLGFVIGPALGGILAGVSPGSPSAPGYVAAGLCFANALVAALWLPESRRSRQRATSRFNLGAALTEVRGSRQVKIILAGYLFITMAFSTLQPTLSLLASERFALGARQAGYLFAMLGLVSAVYQGGVVRALVPRMGERRLFRYSAVPFAAGLLVIGLATDLRLLLAGLVVLGIGYGGAVPAVLGLLSRAASSDRQGGVLGVGQSVGSFARVLGPSMAGALFDVRLAFPYLAGALLILLALLVSRGIAQPEGATR